MTPTPTVSVALCTHNGARYIGEQIASILAQTVPPAQLAVSDDASTDATLEVIDSFAEECARRGIRLTVLRNETALGVTANFERALLACDGDAIALCDQDDVWHPDRIARALVALDSTPVVALVNSDARLVAADGSPLGLTLFDALGVTPGDLSRIHEGRGFELLLRRNLVTGATTMIRRSLLNDAVPFPAPWVHDEWLAMIAAAVARFDVVEAPLIDYRQHGGNQIGVTRLTAIGKLRRLFEPRGGRNDYLAARAVALHTALLALGERVPAETLALAAGKVEHQRVRAALSRRRLSRISPVLREASTGRYSLFSRGRLDILRDLLQPA